MNIESLPPAVLVKIFHYLPLKQQARNAKVSKFFQEISNLAIAETEELIINEDFVAFALCRGLKSVFADWSPKLRRIIVKDGRYQSGHLKLIIGLLTNQTFPRVIDIQFGPDVTQHRGFELIKRCPNLKFLSYNCDRLDSSVTTAAFEKIVHSFPHLETLALSGGLEITDDAIKALSTLSNLRSLKLRHIGPELFFSAAFDRFSECENLTTLELDKVLITPESFVKVVRSCNKLTDLKLHSVVGVHTPKKAIKILESISDLSGETLKVLLEEQSLLCLGEERLVGVWETKGVKETLAKLEKKIEFVIVGY